MPNRSGSAKRKKRNEKAKKVEASQPVDATSSELPCATGTAPLSISGGEEVPKSKENLTDVQKSANGDDERSLHAEPGNKKSTKKKKKRSCQSNENITDLPKDSSLEVKGTLDEKSQKFEPKEDSVCENSSVVRSWNTATGAVMPNRTESTKENKKQSKKAEKLEAFDVTSLELSCTVGAASLSISSDKKMLESKETSTEVDNSAGGDDEKSENPKEEQKKKTKKSKKDDNSNDLPMDSNIERKDTVSEKPKSSETKEDGKCKNSSGAGSCDIQVTSADVVENEREEIAVHEQPDITEERNFNRLIRLLMGVGGNCLRNYFLKIHPTWTNQPSDASALKKGALKLNDHGQKAKFYSGNIDEWDVSLLVSVLRFSAVSSIEVNRCPGVDDAMRSIQNIRNSVIAHAKDKKINAVEFEKYWEKLKKDLIAIGGSEDVIDETRTDHTERALEQYRHLFLEELSLRKFSEQSVEKVKDVPTSSSVENSLQEIQPTPEWDTWLKFCDQMNEFNMSHTQFVLLAGEMTQADLENFKILAALPWSMVIDFNPSSEDDGLYKAFNSQTCLQRVLSPFTPGEISKVGYVGLPKQIDPKRTQWLFANGREEDAESSKPKSFPGWEQHSLRNITMFFACCASVDIFDTQKPLRCLVLPISQAALPFVELTIQRFTENFSHYDLSLACIDNSCNNFSLLKQVQTFQLSSAELKNGVENFFSVTKDQKYEMPCFQSGIRVPFSQKDYVYISEYLELFYIGCQNTFINSHDEQEEQKANEDMHRKWFLSGNLISFLSLFFNHDAKRQIEKDIEIHVQRMLNLTLKQSGIVQIAHPPGTGGSTIARRVLWNLHESFPCASVRLSSQAEFDEDTNFINELSSRIEILEDQCGVPPVILVDGHRQWRIHALSNRIVRTLNSRGKKAVIVECHRGSKPHANADVHKVFHVDARLEDNPADLREFKEKFQEPNQSARRVFHFPLLSMIVEFHDKLESIVSDTLHELDDLEKDIAAFVAFLQLYAEQPTPATLLYDVFQSRLSISKGVQITYQSIKDCFSINLLNLMVHQRKRNTKDDCLTHYTLQHHVVATLLFEKYLESNKKSLYKYAYDFLNCNVPNIQKFVALYCDLFLFNRGGNRTLRFSVLIDQLRRSNSKQAATILRKAAEIIPDPRAYGHAARFYAKMTPPRFQEAEELVASGIKLSESHGRVKSIQDSKGVVHSLELKYMVRHKKVKNIEDLENMAQKALVAFRAGRDFPPTFASPLIGEVEVWISCIEWIVRNHEGDADEAVKFIISKAPPFFRTCIGDCFNLLELVDRMALSVTSITDPDEIRDRAQNFRTALMTAVRPGITDSGRRRNIADSFVSIDPGLKLPKISWKESKRIRTNMLLSLYWREQQSFKPDGMKELMKLLEGMVLFEKDYSFAPHFLQLCFLGNGPRTFNLENGWKVCRNWLEQPDCLDPMRYYYSVIIAFVQILNGFGPSGYFVEYKSLLQKLKDASRGHCRRNQSLHFLKKHGNGMSQLISHQSLVSHQSSYKAENVDVMKSFWKVDSRRKLKECTGRLRVKVEGTKKVTKIELLEGDIELFVGKNAEIGTLGKDFDKDAKVYFVVSFNLAGPVANGITFHPAVDQKKNGASSTH